MLLLITKSKLPLLFSIVLYCLLTCCDKGVAQQRPPLRYDIYLFIGQSNMAGRGKMVSADSGEIENVWILGDKDEIVPAEAPLNFFSTVRKGATMQGINPAYSFARMMGGRSERPILLVVNARGATTLGMWCKGAAPRYYSQVEGDDQDKWGKPIPSLYDEAVRRCTEAMKYGDLKAILWHQGEGNSGVEAVKSYLPTLAGFVADLRADLNSPEVPFIAGEIPYSYANHVNFNPVIRQIGDSIDNAYWVSAEDCPTNSDNVHFSRAGQIIFGERYAAKVIEVVKE